MERQKHLFTDVVYVGVGEIDIVIMEINLNGSQKN